MQQLHHYAAITPLYSNYTIMQQLHHYAAITPSAVNAAITPLVLKATSSVLALKHVLFSYRIELDGTLHN